MSEVAEATVLPDEQAPADAPQAAPALGVLTVGALAWGAAALVFLLLRLAALWHMPVGGVELVHLSGAWQAHAGVEDDRFVATLFQALTAFTFEGTTSELWARLIAFVASATIPLAVWLLRPHFGEAGALAALLLLAIDTPALVLGSSASAMGFDVPLTLWLFVFLVRGWPREWVPAVAGFLVVVSGPLALPVLAGAAVLAAARRNTLPMREFGFAAGGAVLGLAAASSGFGFGIDGLRVPPFDIFASGFDQEWSTANAWQLMALYSWPLVVAGLAVAGALAARLLQREPLDRSTLLLLAWIAFSVGWFLAGAGSKQPLPLAALTLPLALLLGPPLVTAFAAMLRADWTWARFLLPFAAFAAVFAIAIMLDWARKDAVGGAGDQVMVLVWLALAAAALALTAYRSEARQTLLAAALAVAAVVLLPGLVNVAITGGQEPMPSPVSPKQARELRDLALQSRADSGGLIAVHPDYEDAVTWPFRDSGSILIASPLALPPDATFVIWPPSLPPPEGLAVVQGDWALTRGYKSPTGGWLDYLGWFTDRNRVDIQPEPVAVYSKANP